MRTRVRSRRPCRITSCPAACGIRCVKPSSATVSQSCTSSWTASASGTISAISPDLDRERVAAARHRHPVEVRELVDRGCPAEPAEAAVLHTPEGLLRLVADGLVVGVDDPRLDLLRQREATIRIRREDPSGEAVVRAVRSLDRLFGAAHDFDGCYRAERLDLCKVRVLGHL